MRKHDSSNGNHGASPAIDVPPLEPGDRLTRDEFLRIWEMHPEIKFAELIGGIVSMPSPLTREHGVVDYNVSGWLWYYPCIPPAPKAAATLPRC